MQKIFLPLLILFLFSCKKLGTAFPDPIDPPPPPPPPIENTDILFTGSSDLFTLNSTTLRDTQITNLGSMGKYIRYGSWSPDKKKIVFSSNLDNAAFEIYTANADGSAITRITNDTISDYYPKFSPDGSKIAFVKEIPNIVYTPRPGELYVMNSDGSNVTKLTNLNGGPYNQNPADVGSLCWNGNNEIYFTSFYQSIFSASNSLFKYQFSNGAVSSVPAVQGIKADVDISADNKYLVYEVVQRIQVYLPAEIYRSNLDGSNQKKLTNYSQNGTLPLPSVQPSFTKDGNVLFVSYFENAIGEIYQMDSTGSNVTRLTNNSLKESQPRKR